jgi:diguanylate cyclase (GGDEF)-like protein
VREVDVCARYGGDEFVVLLPHTDADSARVVARRIRERLAQATSGWEGAARDVSVSVGIISNEDATLKTPEDLLAAADQALYEAKHQGRNRAVVSSRLPQRQDGDLRRE